MSIYDIHKEYFNPLLWEFVFDDNTDLRFLVKSISLPTLKLTTEVMSTGVKYITEYTAEEEFSIDFLETENLDVYNYLMSWQDQIFDKSRRVFRKGDHTRTASFSLQRFVRQGFIQTALSNSVQFEPSKSFSFEGLLLTSMNNVDFNYTDGEGKVITANFIADSINELPTS